MNQQSEESKKRMDAIFNSRKHLKYPPSTLDEIAEDEFKAGYRAGMQDPEANSERIKQLEGLLGECEEKLDQAVRQWEMHASFHEEDYGDEENIEAKLIKETYAFLRKLKAAKEGK